MDLNAVLKEIDAWPVNEQIELVQQVWDRLAESGWQPDLTDEQKAELDRRIEHMQSNPQDTLSWDEIVEHVKRPR